MKKYMQKNKMRRIKDELLMKSKNRNEWDVLQKKMIKILNNLKNLIKKYSFLDNNKLR